MSIGTAYSAPLLQRIKRNLQNKHAAAASRRAKVCCMLPVVTRKIFFQRPNRGFIDTFDLICFPIEGCVQVRHTSIQ